MAAINFPDSPAVDDLFTYNSVTYKWDGVKWKALSNINNILPSQTGNAGKVLQTNGTDVSWETVLPSGTKMLFAQTAAPTGWTKDTTHNDKALRVVSGTASTGGSVAFTTAFTSQAVAGTVGGTTLTTAQIPSHTHTFSGTTGTISSDHSHGIGGTFQSYGYPSVSSVFTQISSSSTGGVSANHTHAFSGTTAGSGSSGSHTHSFTGTNIDLAVQYVDVIIATKD